MSTAAPLQTALTKPLAAGNANAVLQRKCACGSSASSLTGECEECSQKKRLGLQTKLKINEPGDIYEQEADRVADHVMATQVPHVVSDALPHIHRLAGQPTGQTDAAPPSVDQALAGPGRPLEPALRQDMEQRFGYDFSRVRVHSGATAEQSARNVNAHAYTVGHNLVFGSGQFAPGTHEGRQLIAHELTHVVQQERSGVAAIQCYSDATILAEIEQNVGKADTKAQQLRIEHLTDIFSGLNPVEADELLKRLTARKKGDKLAAEFHYRLSTKSRQTLLGILQRSAVIPLVKVKNLFPPDDPKYIDKVIDSVESSIRRADRYTLKWKGGQTTVYGPLEIDPTGKSKAFSSLVDIHDSKTNALATAVEWRDDAKAMGYDTVVTYYRGAADVVLPTWISPETAPVTYDLIKGLNLEMQAEVKAGYDFFRNQRNGLIFAAVLGGALKVIGKIAPRVFPLFFGEGGVPSAPTVAISNEPGGGGSIPQVAPKVEPSPTQAPKAPVAESAPEPVKGGVPEPITEEPVTEPIPRGEPPPGEVVGEYRINAEKGDLKADGTYERVIWGIKRIVPRTTEERFEPLFRRFIEEARASGAARLRVIGRTIRNQKVFRNVSQMEGMIESLGGKIETPDPMTVEIIIPL